MSAQIPAVGAGAGWGAAERADSAVCASVLATGGWWWGWMLTCGMLAAATAWARHDLWLGGGLCVGWLLGTWWAVRVHLDGRLFHWMAQAGGPLSQGGDLDAALRRVLRGSPRGASELFPRSMAERVAGAMRLYRCLVAWSILHGGGALAYLLWAH